MVENCGLRIADFGPATSADNVCGRSAIRNVCGQSAIRDVRGQFAIRNSCGPVNGRKIADHGFTGVADLARAAPDHKSSHTGLR